jgi:uncharacterized membrane protein
MLKLKFSSGLILFLIVINVLPILAPVCLHFDFDLPARIIYFVYSFFCHQIHWRSLHIFDYQCAWCARDMAIWSAFLITALFVKTYKLKGLKFYQILPFVIPIALDGGIQTLATALGLATSEPLYVSSNLLRMITGSIFGIGLGLTVMSIAISLEEANITDQISLFKGKFKLHQLFLVPIVFVFLFLSYLAFIQIWDLTSQDYKPSNALDSEIKIPEDQDLWFQRRANAICPVDMKVSETDADDLFAFDCFFKTE